MKSIKLQTSTEQVGQFSTNYNITSIIKSNGKDTHQAFVEIQMDVAASGTDNYDSKIPEFTDVYKIDKGDDDILNVESTGIKLTINGEKEIKVFNQHLKHIVEEIDKLYPPSIGNDPYPINTNLGE